jgi:hypothetical protein
VACARLGHNEILRQRIEAAKVVPHYNKRVRPMPPPRPAPADAVDNGETRS